MIANLILRGVVSVNDIMTFKEKIYGKDKFENLDIKQLISNNKISDNFSIPPFDSSVIRDKLIDFAKKMNENLLINDELCKHSKKMINNQEIIIHKLDEVMYDNILLNYPELLKDLFSRSKDYTFASKYNCGELLDRVNNLSPEIIGMAINDNDSLVLIGGLISLENFS